MVKSSIEIDWCNLSQLEDDWLLGAFEQLNEQFQFHYPDLPTPSFKPLPVDLLPGLSDYLLSSLPGSVCDISYEEYEAKRLFVLCNGDEDFVSVYQGDNELAHWGVAIPCKLAIAWHPGTYLVWHEVMHLFDAKDCYNKFGINKCPNPTCLMRRSPTPSNCGHRLSLCSKNIKRVKRSVLQ